MTKQIRNEIEKEKVELNYELEMLQVHNSELLYWAVGGYALVVTITSLLVALGRFESKNPYFQASIIVPIVIITVVGVKYYKIFKMERSAAKRKRRIVEHYNVLLETKDEKKTIITKKSKEGNK